MSPGTQDTHCFGLQEGQLDALLSLVLSYFVAALERRPDLAARLSRMLAVEAPSAPRTEVQFMSVAQYAAHRHVSERTIRYDLKKMSDGLQFERAGRAGRRIVIRVADADQWHRDKQRERMTTKSLDDLAVDEVTRRRASVALRKRKRER
jgi:hypothetical protein